MRPPATAAGQRLAFLDCLRAMAVVLVFITHATAIFAPVAGGGEWVARLAHALNFGRIGVVVFFAVSGFVIPFSLKGEARNGSLRFAISRFFRLYPAFWVSIPFAVIAQHWLMGEAFGMHAILYNLTMLPRLFGAPMANGAYWTLEVELFFYVACALLFAGGVLGNAFVTALLALGLGFLFWTSQRRLFGGLLNPGLGAPTFYFWFHISIMFWGATCRRVWQKEALGALPAALFWFYTLYILAWRPITLAYHLAWRHDSTQDIRLFCGYVGGMWIFVLCVFLRPIRVAALAWFGRISYSFYLLHGSVIYGVLWLVHRHALPAGWDIAWYLAVGGGITTALAAASYYAIERPFIAVGRKATEFAA